MRKQHQHKIVLALDSQALTAFKNCPYKYWLGYQQHLVQLGRKAALDTGTLVHEMLHRYNRALLYQRRWNLSETQLLNVVFKFISRAKSLTQEEKVFHQRKFLEFLSIHKTSKLVLKGTEVPFSRVIHEDRDAYFVYEGRVDNVSLIDPMGQLTWVDYKTQSREYALYGNTDQFLGYSWALKTNFGHVFYYGLQKEKSPSECFKIDKVYHHPSLIDQWKEETIKVFREIASRLAFGEGQFERNRSVCDIGKFGKCQFVPICDNIWAGEAIINGIKTIRYRVRDKWSPWK